MFPLLPARATFVADTKFVFGTLKMFLILFRNLLCPQQVFPSLRSPRNIMRNNVSARVSSFARALRLVSFPLISQQRHGASTKACHSLAKGKVLSYMRAWCSADFIFPKHYLLNPVACVNSKSLPYVRNLWDKLNASYALNILQLLSSLNEKLSHHGLTRLSLPLAKIS